ncbi:HEPACAM family member 2 [Thamnophis elegans]|uniref:HEPACAM family member 2 n=1 Tax=Thamnophis elegans TaxID=35005 RepID=UPI0013777DEF|nr:HEPACAM family member 2 [Thamnophis elegans]
MFLFKHIYILGHQSAGDDFGVYEFIEYTSSRGTPWPPRRRGAADSDVGQSQNTVTIYDVVQHVPEQNEEQQMMHEKKSGSQIITSVSVENQQLPAGKKNDINTNATQS